MATQDVLKKLIDEEEKKVNSSPTPPQVEKTPADIGKAEWMEGQTAPSTTPTDMSKMEVNATPPTETLTPEQKLQDTKVAKVETPVMTAEQIEKLTRPNRELTEREKDILTRKEKRNALIGAIGDGLSAMADMYFTSQGALSTHDPSQDLSLRAKKRWENVIAKRNAEKEKEYLRYQTDAEKQYSRKLKERELNLRAEATANEKIRLAQQAQRYGYDQDYKAWQMGFKEQQEANRQRQYANQNAISWARINKTSDKTIPFEMADGSYIEVDTARLRDKTYISHLFSKLPEEIRTKTGKPIKDSLGNITGYYPPTADEMRAAIGANIDYVKDDLGYTPTKDNTPSTRSTSGQKKSPTTNNPTKKSPTK